MRLVGCAEASDDKAVFVVVRRIAAGVRVRGFLFLPRDSETDLSDDDVCGLLRSVPGAGDGILSFPPAFRHKTVRRPGKARTR